MTVRYVPKRGMLPSDWTVAKIEHHMREVMELVEALPHA